MGEVVRTDRSEIVQVQARELRPFRRWLFALYVVLYFAAVFLFTPEGQALIGLEGRLPLLVEPVGRSG